MLGIPLRDMNRNNWVRGKTETRYIIKPVTKLNWKYAEHTSRRGWSSKKIKIIFGVKIPRKTINKMV